MRERLVDSPPINGIAGITPAYAGKTHFEAPTAWRAEDHPRVCGKDLPPQKLHYLALGSPPRMRERPAEGIRSSGIGEDHPRVCGKDRVTLRRRTCISGSPPRMRERLVDSPPINGIAGITPAYAGKTHFEAPTAWRAEDHPRVCGKDNRRCRGICGLAGSPPRMRERPWDVDADFCRLGITPAYAGKTVILRSSNTTFEDHPRVCGKDMNGKGEIAPILGSPPRMRERRLLRRYAKWLSGITPRERPSFFAQYPDVAGSPPRCGKDPAFSPNIRMWRITPRMRERRFAHLSVVL